MENARTLKDELGVIRASAKSYFTEVDRFWLARQSEGRRDDGNSEVFLNSLEISLKRMIAELESQIAQWAARLTSTAQASALLSSADQSDLRINVRQMVAALSFKEYQYYEAHLMSWEDSVYGVQPASQQERYIDVRAAEEQFNGAAERVSHTLLFVQAERYQNIAPSQVVPPISGAQQRPDTAFIMMWMSNEHPELDDVKAAIVEVFREFHIHAIRADDIEHEDVITERIKQEIASSEFLIADLTGARPNVYYEVGYAHALNKRVILYRRKDVDLHFDLAGRNVPEYINVSDLKQKLRQRLTAMLGFESSTTSRVVKPG